jgi:hypothetical protein
MRSRFFSLALGAFATLCVACALARGLAPLPEKAVNLTGEWHLNATLSDDARKKLDEAQSRVKQQFQRRQEAYRRSEQLDRDPQGDYETRALERGPYRDFGPVVDGPMQFTMTQNGGNLTIMSDDSENRFEAGRQSVVSFGQGVADRRVGWTGQTFVIATRAVDGQAKEERYSLDKDGRLVVTVQMGGGGLPKVLIRRVYDRADA